MTRRKKKSEYLAQDALQLQVMADDAKTAQNRAILTDAADRAAHAAETQRRRERHDVIELPATAYDTQLADSRRRGAVRYGNDTYLPSWLDHQDLLPLLLMTGGMFGAGEFSTSDDSMVYRKTLATAYGARLGYTGPRLNQEVLHVYTAALMALRDTPLSAPDMPTRRTSKLVTFHEFITKYYGTGYSAETHRNVRDYLAALSAGSMVLWTGHQELPLPALLRAGFYEPSKSLVDLRVAADYTKAEMSRLRGGDVIMLSMSSELAQLFAQNNISRYAVTDCGDRRKSRIWNKGSQLDSWLALRNICRQQAETESLLDLHAQSNTDQSYDNFCVSMGKSLARLKAKGVILDYIKTKGKRGQPGRICILMKHMRNVIEGRLA